MSDAELRLVVKAKDEASRTLKGVGGSFKALGKVAKVGMAVAAVGVGILVAAIAGLIGFVLKAKDTYESWMQQLDDFQDVTEMSAKATSLLVAEFRLADVEVEGAQKSIAIFTRRLGEARQGMALPIEMFNQLRVSIYEADGSVRPLNEVLLETRDRLHGIEDPARRAAIAQQLFGRGWATMADWIAKSNKELEAYRDFIRSLGMEMGGRSMKAFQQYRENQRKVSFAWDAIKINAFAALVPLINTLSGPLISALQDAAGWVARLRRKVEKKGWEKAIHEMVPELEDVWDLLKKAWNAARDFGTYIIDHKDDIKRAFEAILTVVNGIARAINVALEAARLLASINLSGGTGSGSHREGAHSGSSATAGAKRPGRAAGGPVYAPTSGEEYVLHGRETVVAHADPRYGLQDLVRSGILGGAPVVNVYLDSEPVAARVEVRQAQRARVNARTKGLALA